MSSTQPQETKDLQTDQTFYNSLASALHRLQEGYLRGDRAKLATLRRAAGKNPEKDHLAWFTALDSLLPDFPYRGQGDQASPAERAAFNALTLYALHQRSLSQPMHVKGWKSLGRATAELALRTESKSIKKRLDALMTARTYEAKNYHLRSLIGLLHAYEIPLDYAQLASDLWSLQNNNREKIILRWGRDYAFGLWKNQNKES